MSDEPAIRFRLYAVANEAVCDGEDFADRLAALGELGGARLGVYIRDDRPSSARRALAALRSTSTPVFVRRAALASGDVEGAAGVHLTTADLGEVGITRRVRRTDPALLIGASIHDVAQSLRAKDAACAFGLFGHVFATPSKPGIPGRGVGALGSACQAADPMPVLAIGGITPAHVSSCLEAGAAGVAAVRGLFGVPDPRPMLEAYLEALGTESNRR